MSTPSVESLSVSTGNMGASAASAASPVSTAASNIERLASAIRSIPASTTHSVTISVRESSAKGNVQIVSGKTGKLFSFAKGNAFAGGKSTLMGELGPELVVSNGGYYIVGQNGSEMVDLPKDAIVFNH